VFSGKNVTIQLKNHKTPNNWGNLVILYWLKLKLFCPIRSLKKLKGVLIRGGHATDGLTLTQRNFLKIVKSMLAEVGVFAGGISGKSFRWGFPPSWRSFPKISRRGTSSFEQMEKLCLSDLHSERSSREEANLQSHLFRPDKNFLAQEAEEK
jgi:hypothetical protein